MFPRTSIYTKKLCICICGTQGLKSAQRDAYSIVTTMTILGFECHVFIDDHSDIDRINQRMSNKILPTYHSSLNDVDVLLNKVKSSDVPYDIFMSISAHGYSRGQNSNYFMFNSKCIDRKIMRPETPQITDLMAHFLSSSLSLSTVLPIKAM